MPATEAYPVTMSNQSSQDHLRSRAEQERAAAECAGDERAAQAHRELAEYYEKLAAGEPLPDERCERPAAGIVSTNFRIIP